MRAKTALNSLEHLIAKFQRVTKFAVGTRRHFGASDPALHAEAFTHQVTLLGLKSQSTKRQERNLMRFEATADFFNECIIIFLPLRMPDQRIEVEGDRKT